MYVRCANFSFPLTRVADLEGFKGVRSNPSVQPNHVISMVKFNKCCMTLGKQTPSLNLNPLLRNPGSAPACCFVSFLIVLLLSMFALTMLFCYKHATHFCEGVKRRHARRTTLTLICYLSIYYLYNRYACLT